MMSAEKLPPARPFDPVAAVARHLRDGDETVRCAAARALGALGDETAAPVLVEALLDEDPDVRSDAMAALGTCGRPQDADTIRRSLMGDPVKEVKVSAIQALSNLRDEASVPLLRELAKHRCEGEVAWEDDAGMWDDWIDVQIAAVAALGEFGDPQSIDDLLEARSDEMGQDLDGDVFAALAKIPDGGIAALIGLLRDRNARVRERALGALSKARRDLLVPMTDLLLRDASPDIRRLAIGGLDPDSTVAFDLALYDPDAAVRQAALTAFAERRPDVARTALKDSDETARAIALEGLMAGPHWVDLDDLRANVEAWMETGGTRLATTCAAILPRLPGAAPVAALRTTASNQERPLEARIAAVRSLGALASDEAIETLRQLLVDPLQQVRTSALASLAELAKLARGSHCAKARDLLVGAIRGEFTAEITPKSPSDLEQPSSAVAPKMEDAASGQVRISPDGEILRDDHEPESNVIKAAFPKSTLDAIQNPAGDASGATEDPPSEADVVQLAQINKGRRRRVAVDGPSDVAGDIRAVAMRVAAGCPGPEVEHAMAETLDGGDGARRTAAFSAIALRAETIPLSDGVVATLVAALGDSDSLVRGHAARALANSGPDAADHLSALLDDSDVLVRALALKSVATAAPAKAIAGLRDDSAPVRRAAIEVLVEHGTQGALEDGVRVCLQECRADSLAEAITRKSEAQEALISTLAAGSLQPHQLRAALEALSSTESL